MNILASDSARDRTIARELVRAGIELIRLNEPSGDVPSRLRGLLGPIAFTRGLNCWIADGPLPIAVARVLSTHPISRRDFRIGGSADRPAPQGPWVAWYTPAGERVYPVAYKAGLGKTAEQWPELVRSSVPIVFHDEPARIGAAGYIDLYHIDSADGLQVFASTLRAHRIDQLVRPAWWNRHTLAMSRDRSARIASIATRSANRATAASTWDGDTQPMPPDGD